jgi:hypothetical protein
MDADIPYADEQPNGCWQTSEETLLALVDRLSR